MVKVKKILVRPTNIQYNRRHKIVVTSKNPMFPFFNNSVGWKVLRKWEVEED